MVDTLIRVKNLLSQYPETRNSDKHLLDRYYELFERVYTKLSSTQTPVESITRARRKVQELCPELGAEKLVSEFRSAKERSFRSSCGVSGGL